MRVVSSDSSSDSSSEEEIDDDEEEEIEEITTEGARANGIVSSNRGQSGVAAGPYHPNALKTEMNKVDVIVDGRPVAGMYQVVHHRIETISTTNAVVPRSVIEEQQVGIDLISRKSRVGGKIVKSWKLFFVKCSSSKIIPFFAVMEKFW